jgi:catechol 2,3-dioxygenase-like lactoylglutathione lyase family enzyme
MRMARASARRASRPYGSIGTGGAGGAHIAFRASEHAAIEKFHAEGMKAGGRDNGGAGLRTDYSPTYFAAFLIDPDGNNVEAVCT